MSALGPVRELGCCCCGNSTRGRQWWNRDTGYGICDGCIEFVRKHGETEAEIRDNYGVEGIHWDGKSVAGGTFERGE
jgi:hypothetical protein